MSKRQAWRDAVTSLWKDVPKQPSTQDELKTLGLTTIADQKFEKRQKLLAQLLGSLTEEIAEDEPIEQVKELKELLNDVHTGIHLLAAPYYQVLENFNYYRLMRGWSAWHALANLWISTVKGRIEGVEKQQPTEKKDMREEDLEQMVEGILAKKFGNQPPKNLELTETEDYELFPMMSESKDTIIDIQALVSQLTSVLYLHVFQDANVILLDSYSAEDVREKWAVVVQSEPSYRPRIIPTSQLARPEDKQYPARLPSEPED